MPPESEDGALPGSDGIVTSSHTTVEQPSATTTTTAAPSGETTVAPGAAAPTVDGDKPTDTAATTEPPGDENKGKERLNARFSELTSQRRAAEEARDAEKQRADTAEAELARMRNGATTTTTTTSEGPPNPADYELGEYDPKYIDARVQHAVRAALAGERQAAEHQEQQRREGEAIAAYQGTVSSVRAKLLDSGLSGAALLASGDNSIPCTPFMIQVLGTLDKAPEVADHLATNIAEATRIASLPPHLQGVELARIEARLAKPVEVSRAPGTTPTVSGLAPPSDDFNPNMSQAEFEAQVTRKHGGFNRPGFG